MENVVSLFELTYEDYQTMIGDWEDSMPAPVVEELQRRIELRS